MKKPGIRPAMHLSADIARNSFIHKTLRVTVGTPSAADLDRKTRESETNPDPIQMTDTPFTRLSVTT